ncbi:Polyprenol reductase [Thalictrum thalictroides]|uniref:Polyprenol reductase n=1 Tax=Thalictrum thalictroides TaxID=46969 RepID=A0A7J6WMX1_THATH|nr:Polyprenol reductase [Thalictrum thalictroides]
MELEEFAKLLLRVAWIAGILPILVASVLSSSSRFHQLLSSFANRGKTFSLFTSNKFTVPQRFFLHFYVLAVVWTTLLLLITWLYALGVESATIANHLTGGESHILSRRYIVWRTVFLLLLMEVQVWRRLYETVYVFNYSPTARMHIVGYFTGLFFYTAAPLSLCSRCAPDMVKFSFHGLAEFTGKGQYEVSFLKFDWSGFVNPLMKLGWFQWIGASIFIWGWIHQCRCHAILGSLRHKEHTNEYVVPHGDWFEIVSCPHYLAEIVIYGGLLITSGGSDLTIWLLFGFVVVNLVFAATETQRWYLRKFENYPRTRGAILPFVY